MFLKGNRRDLQLECLEITTQETSACQTAYVMSLQVQAVQHVYPPQVQYVEGGDAVYANGALYVAFLSPGTGSPQRPRGHIQNLLSRPSTLVLGDVFAQTPLRCPLGDMFELSQQR